MRIHTLNKYLNILVILLVFLKDKYADPYIK